MGYSRHSTDCRILSRSHGTPCQCTVRGSGSACEDLNQGRGLAMIPGGAPLLPISRCFFKNTCPLFFWFGWQFTSTKGRRDRETTMKSAVPCACFSVYCTRPGRSSAVPDRVPLGDGPVHDDRSYDPPPQPTAAMWRLWRREHRLQQPAVIRQCSIRALAAAPSGFASAEDAMRGRR